MQKKIEAVQLELGVGLRWPGPDRERFVEIFCRTLANGATPDWNTQEDGFPALPVAAPKTTMQPHLNGSSPLFSQFPDHTRFGLHFHDPLSGLGIMGGIEFGGGESSHSGRLMLSLGGTEMALFTGEDAAGRSYILYGLAGSPGGASLMALALPTTARSCAFPTRKRLFG